MNFSCILYMKIILKSIIMKKLIIVWILWLATTGMLSAKEITGTVKDESGNVLPGVTVNVEKTNRGTVTDFNGYYKIQVLPDDKFLVFSFVGMETRREKIGEKVKIDVVLKTATLELEEIVIADQAGRSDKQTMGYVTLAKSSQMISGVAMMPQNWNTENYSTIHENGFKDVINNPLSTFSIDVDNASYSNVRRFINNGELPPVDAVRVEEMINYFKYDYPEPNGEQPFSVNTELGKCPWNESHYLMHIGLKGKSIEKENLPPSNLVFLIDVSGSMTHENKLPLLKRAFKMLVNELRPEDRVSIVVYAGAAGKVLDSTPGDEKQEILEALENLSAGGSTAGGEGIKLAYKIARENFIKDGNNRIILATDGDFNIGVSSTSEMERLVEKERESGIFMSVLGFGTGNIKDDKMETIADKGNGNYAYIDNIQEARKVFISEFGGTLFTIAKDVKFQLEFNPKQVKAYRLVGYENRLLNDEEFNDDTKDAGEMGSGHTVTALYEIIPANSDDEIPSVDPLKYQDSKSVSEKFSKELLTVKLRYKDPKGGKSKLLEQSVDAKMVRKTSDDYRFSAAVASFGMLLRNSGYKGDTTIASILELAKNAKGVDAEGYRSEFIQLVKTVDDLKLIAEK